ncbi:protein FAM76A [Eupeodes corollae]|uniref:protein FAM76A n=1 Tax=Eupeodes corollae TaxID=290404 RepID=UPI0024915664|nr:protein FAM76A [Eupeodes corollae]
MSGKVLFACSKCFSRHPFEELSSGQQLCKNCRTSSTSVAKCTYCRSEHQPTSKSSVCKKCEQSLKQYGKPNACECCNIVAAFGSSKCQRCTSYEAKFGQPVTCDWCKQRSAFDKNDENKKVNGKLLCWLCTCSYKRALAKANQDGRMTKKRPQQHKDSSKKSKQSRSEMSKNSTSLEMPDKSSRQNSSSASGGGNGNGGGNNGGGNGGRESMPNVPIVAPAVVSIDPNSSDHVVAMTELKERIASLERKLVMKDKDLLEKDKQLTELKGINFEKENEMRNKLKENDRIHEMKVDQLNHRIANLLKEVATLKRGSKKNGTSGGGKDKESASGKDSGGSGTESPITN